MSMLCLAMEFVVFARPAVGLAGKAGLRAGASDNCSGFSKIRAMLLTAPRQLQSWTSEKMICDVQSGTRRSGQGEAVWHGTGV